MCCTLYSFVEKNVNHKVAQRIEQRVTKEFSLIMFIQDNINNNVTINKVSHTKSVRTIIVLVLLRKHFYDAGKSTTC